MHFGAIVFAWRWVAWVVLLATISAQTHTDTQKIDNIIIEYAQRPICAVHSTDSQHQSAPDWMILPALVCAHSSIFEADGYHAVLLSHRFDTLVIYINLKSRSLFLLFDCSYIYILVCAVGHHSAPVESIVTTFVPLRHYVMLLRGLLRWKPTAHRAPAAHAAQPRPFISHQTLFGNKMRHNICGRYPGNTCAAFSCASLFR